MRLEVPRHPLDEQVELAGETFAIKGIKKVCREQNMPIHDDGSTLEDLQCILAPEPWNPHDPNAVAVMVGAHQVGYLPAGLARDYGRPLAALANSGVCWQPAAPASGRTVLIPEGRSSDL